MKKESNNFSTFVKLLQYRATYQKDRVAFIFLVDGEMQEVRITYGVLHQKAKAIAATLQKDFSPGDRALLLYPFAVLVITALL